MTMHYVNPEPDPVDRLRVLEFPGLVGGHMDITTCAVNGAAASLSDGPVASLRLPRTLAAGESADIVLAWRTAVPRVDGGGPFSRGDGFASLAWCFPVPVSSRTGTDLPAPYADWLCTDAASWRVRVSLPAGMLLVAAGTEIGRTGIDGRTVVDLALAPARDFYLAVGSGLREHAPRQAAGNGPVVRCFAPPGREAAAAFATEAAAKAIAGFARRFGPYPYESFTILAGPLASLGIEFPGLTVIGEAVFSLDGTLGGVPARAMLEATVVHEVAHQWFYNLVGSDQASEPWLDEAVAQYATRLYYLDRYGEAAAGSYADSWWSRWDRVDRAQTPIGLPVSAYSAKEYGAIVYGRGPLFLETLAASMGGRVFDGFLRTWATRNAWRIARGADFLAAAEAACGRDLDALFAAWVEAR
jgi:aminopeptidase N